MGSKLNNGYVGSNELEFVNTRGYSDTDGKGILSGTKNYLEEEKKVWRHETDFIRNPEWLEMPEIPEGEEKAIGLLAIYPNVADETNAIAINARNNYIVDWGDGTTAAYSSATTNGHTYDFNSIDPSTETSEGYRQVLVTVTPQPGQSLERVYFNTSLDSFGIRATDHHKDYLEFVARLPNVRPDYMSIPNSQLLKRVVIHELLNLGNMASMFENRREVRYVYLPYDLSNITSTYRMFANCRRLKNAPYFDTSSSTNFQGMFAGCDNLKRVPKYDLSSATNVRQMFVACVDLQYIPDLNLSSSCTDARELFNRCISLRECPNLGDTSGITTLEYIFRDCVSIKEIPALDLTSCTNAYSFANNCYNLEKVNTITFNSSLDVNCYYMFAFCDRLRTADIQGTQSSTSVREMFHGCQQLEGVTLDAPSATGLGVYRTFRYCNSLKTLPAGFNTSLGTNLSNLFEECWSLTEMNNVDFSSATNTTNMFYNMRSLRKVSGITGPPITHDWSYRPLEPDSIRNIFEGLPTVVGQTINMFRTAGILSGGVTAGDIAVATAKGWTVTT